MPGLKARLDWSFGEAFYELLDMSAAALVDVADGAAPDDFAFEQHGDFVGDFARGGHVMRDGDGGRAEGFDLLKDEIIDGVGGDRVEAGGWFIEEDQIRLGDDGTGEADALLHAA